MIINNITKHHNYTDQEIRMKQIHTLRTFNEKLSSFCFELRGNNQKSNKSIFSERVLLADFRANLWQREIGPSFCL